MGSLRIAVRTLSRSPGFSFSVAGLLALGIGATTAIFSIFDAVLLRPLPVNHPERLVRMVQRFPKSVTADAFPYDYYVALRDHSSTFQKVFAETPDYYHFPMTSPEPAEQISVRAVTAEYFDALGITAAYGRILTPGDEDETPGDPPAVVSYSFWHRRFAEDRNVIGRNITLHDHEFVIVGVLPQGFNGINTDTGPDVRVPNRAFPLLTGYPGTNRTMELFGYLKAGVSRETAESESQAMFQSVVAPEYADTLKEFPQSGVAALLRAGMNLDPVERGESILRERYADVLRFLLACVGTLLLIVCTNVAGILLVQMASRIQEIAVKLALGASRISLAREMFAETSLLGAFGGLAGLWIAFLATPLITRLLPPIRDRANNLFPLSLDVRMNARVFLVTLILTAASVLLFSVAPAIAASNLNLDTILRGARSSGRWRKRRVFITIQVALGTILLVGASLFVQTLVRLHRTNPGFDQYHIATFTGDISLAQKPPSFLNLLTERVQQIPGVASAAISSIGVMRGHGAGNTIAPAGMRMNRGDDLNTNFDDVSVGYFDTMGIQLLAGRSLESSDVSIRGTATPVNVVVNQAFVQRFYPTVNPVGQRFGAVSSEMAVAGPDYEIVGVARNAKYRSLREPMMPIYYEVGMKYGRFVLDVKTRVRPESIFVAVQKSLSSIDPSVAFLEIHKLSDEVNQSTSAERLIAALASTFAGIATLLVGAGVYGLLAIALTMRRREIGIRRALGARSVHIVGMAVRQTITIAVVGIVCGLAAAIGLGPAIRSLLYGVPPTDPESLIAAALLMLIVAGAAALLSSLRALRIEPSTVLGLEK